jgi:hypothetical protein
VRAQPVINFYQINNYADQMINQYQVVSVSNSAPNAVLTVGVDERSTNNGNSTEQFDGRRSATSLDLGGAHRYRTGAQQ